MGKLPVAVAIQVTDKKLKDDTILDEIQQVGETPARFIEFRIDYSSNPSRADLSTLIKHAREQDLESIVTCRHEQEGGMFKGDDEQRMKMYSFILDNHPDYIDVEISNKDDILRGCIDAARGKGTRIILSYHDFERTVHGDDLKDLIDMISKKLQEFSDDELKSIMVKIIFMANYAEDNPVPFEVIKQLSSMGCNVISFCMGDKGIVSRIMSILPRKGDGKSGYLTFASISDGTAPGQVHISTLSEIIKPFFT